MLIAQPNAAAHAHTRGQSPVTPTCWQDQPQLLHLQRTLPAPCLAVFHTVWLSFDSHLGSVWPCFNVFHGLNRPSFRICFHNDIHQCPSHRHICARRLFGLFGNQCAALLSVSISDLPRMPRHPRTQPTLLQQPHTGPLSSERSSRTRHVTHFWQASHWNRLLPPQGMLYSPVNNTHCH